MERNKYKAKGHEILKAVLPELVVSHGVSVSGLEDLSETQHVCSIVAYRMRKLGYKVTSRCFPTRFVIRVERDYEYRGGCSIAMLTEADRAALDLQSKSFQSNRSELELELVKSVAEARKEGIATIFVPEGKTPTNYKASVSAALRHLGYDDIMVLHGKDRLCLITVETES